jgi:hypothetical protein
MRERWIRPVVVIGLCLGLMLGDGCKRRNKDVPPRDVPVPKAAPARRAIEVPNEFDNAEPVAVEPAVRRSGVRRPRVAPVVPVDSGADARAGEAQQRLRDQRLLQQQQAASQRVQQQNDEDVKRAAAAQRQQQDEPRIQSAPSYSPPPVPDEPRIQDAPGPVPAGPSQDAPRIQDAPGPQSQPPPQGLGGFGNA